jgi:hypothetical protein
VGKWENAKVGKWGSGENKKSKIRNQKSVPSLVIFAFTKKQISDRI